MLAAKIKPGGANTMLQENVFVGEPKYDGERVMCHFSKSEDRVVFWTRNAIDYTKQYNSMIPTLQAQLSCNVCQCMCIVC